MSSLGFELDPFQARALDALDRGGSLLVAAPTGSGKTVVAEYAISKALGEGSKSFYTTPLKALSNQKYTDLAGVHGPETIGLLTGDNSVNGEAHVVVMTTEVLRNMIYARSPTLQGLRYVVLDEVHYLQDPYRGAVWEEVIIHAPAEVSLICLSATVSNAEQFADWIRAVRGPTTAIIDEHRPVALHHLYLVGDRSAERTHVLPTFVDGNPNPEATGLDASRRRRAGARRRLYTPRRLEVVERLAEEEMLPAIYFIFSRAGCEQAVRACLESGARLTTPAERSRIRAVAEEKVEALSDEDLRVLGYGPWLAGMEAGLAPHHAGLVPAFKEAVELCFASALVKVVFATETLALGINMPARTVVIERLSKFTGERHELLTPGEYTQLTGRAGRRGIDDVGFGAVLWSPFTSFASVAGLASTRSYELRSSFRPTYNMAANLVQRYSASRAHHLLNLSFAQYRSDAEVVRLEADLERLEERAADAERAARCDRGDVDDYRHNLGRGPRAAEHGSRSGAVRSALEALKPGDVLRVPGLPGGPADGTIAVITTARRRGGRVRIGGVSRTGRTIALSSQDFASPPVAASRIVLPTPYNPASTRFVRAVATSLRRLRVPADAPWTRLSSAKTPAPGVPAGGPDVPRHPVAACPDLAAHLRAAERAERLHSAAERQRAAIRARNESLARQFDRVLELLAEWGYVDGWAVTAAGARLARVYHEEDLLIAQSLQSGLMDSLDPPSLAALASVFTFEQRRPGPEVAERMPTGELGRRWVAVRGVHQALSSSEASAGLTPTRAPDAGFAAIAHGWVRGLDLDAVLADGDLSGGDFVRNVKQLIDLLRQLAEVAPDPRTRQASREAAEAAFRGVVAASSVVGTDLGPADDEALAAVAGRSSTRRSPA